MSVAKRVLTSFAPTLPGSQLQLNPILRSSQHLTRRVRTRLKSGTTTTNDYVGDAVVTSEGGNLRLLLGPGDRVFGLEHWDRDVFLYYPVAEVPCLPVSLTFTLRPDGRTAQVVIDDLNGNGQGVLTRVEEGN